MVAIKNELLRKSKEAYNKEPLYWMQVTWGIMHDQAKHFSERMRPADFQAGRREEMRWPTTELKRELFAMMRLPISLNYDDLPQQYRDHAGAVGKDAGPGAGRWM